MTRKLKFVNMANKTKMAKKARLAKMARTAKKAKNSWTPKIDTLSTTVGIG